MNKQIIQYLEQHKNQYARETLFDQLMKAGYKNEDIIEAARFVYGNTREAGVKTEENRQDELASERVRNILKKAGVVEKPKKRKIIKTIILAIILYFVFFVILSISDSMRGAGLSFLINSGIVFIFSPFSYILELFLCNNYYSRDGFFILQIIYVLFWVFILSYSFNKEKNNKILDAWMNRLKMGKKYLPLLIVLILIGLFMIINFTLTTSGYNRYGRQTTCFSFVNNLQGCYEESYYINNEKRITRVSSQGKNFYSRCNTATGSITKYRCQDDKVVEEVEKCASGCYTNNSNACASEKDKCYDSDGEDYYTRGSITQGGRTNYDYCSGDYIYEYKCVNNFEYRNVFFQCPNGCQNGACQKSDLNNDFSNSNSKCLDSDNGKDYFKAGNVIFTIQGEQMRYNDYCTGQDSIVEYFCTDDLMAGSINFDCPNGCQNGVCIN